MNPTAAASRKFLPPTETLVRYAGASGDFYEIHYDEDAAAAAGLDDLPVHGLLKMAWLVDLAEELAGPNVRLSKTECRYAAVDYRRRTLTAHAEVTSRTATQAIVRMWIKNDHGVETTVGFATFARIPHC